MVHKVRPSDVRKVGYCPTMYFFDRYLALKAPLTIRLKALWGRFLHTIHALIRLGWVNERLIKVPVERLGITIVGKPDSFRVIEKERKVIIEEFKSHKAPRGSSPLVFHGAWLSDALQLMTYALMFKASTNYEPELIVRYIDKAVKIPYDEVLLLRYIELLKNISEGVFPEPTWVTPNKCRRCPYKEICPYSPYRKIELRGFNIENSE